MSAVYGDDAGYLQATPAAVSFSSSTDQQAASFSSSTVSVGPQLAAALQQLVPMSRKYGTLLPNRHGTL